MRLLAVCTVLALVATPAVHGQADAAGVPVAFTLEHGFDASTVVERNCPQGDCTDDAANCGSGHITRQTNGVSFTFAEDAVGTGCAQAWTEIPVPAGTATLTLTFWADRNVERQTDPLGQDFEIHAEQEVLVYVGGPDAAPARIPVFDSSQESQEGRTHAMTIQLGQLGEQGGGLGLSWFFSDAGALGSQTIPVPDGNVAYSSTVRDIRVRLEGQMPEPASAHDAARRKSEGQEIETFRLDVPLPRYEGAPVRGPIEATLRFDLRAHAVEAVWGPGDTERQRLALTEVQTDEDALPATVWITRSFDGSVPGGAYDLALVYRPPLDRTDVPWLAALVLALPLVAAVPASRNIHTYRAQARGPYLRTARALGVVGVAGWIVYAILVAVALLVIGWSRLVVFPPGTEVLLMTVQLVVIFLGFVVLWNFAGRTYVDAMRRDLHRRDQQEAELRRSNEELERFAYVASHDLQEPLRKVAASTMMIRKRYEGHIDEAADKWIGYAVDGAHRMQDMIRSLLTYSRAGQGELALEDVDVGALVREIRDDLATTIQEKDATVTISDLPTLRADQMRLRQVFQNLVQNGLKYQAKGRKPKIRVDAVRDGAGWDIRVQDNGIGIPEGRTKEVFGAFRRLHGRDEYDGTGIGLAIAARIVERHEGRIWVESKEGKGSTFHVWLPEEGPARTGETASGAT